ncbi:MAG: type VII secretion target [Kibdelosporangium sp.]
MPDGFTVDTDQIRTHAVNVEAVLARFDAVRAASSHIAQDDQAYGLLCGWISGALEGKHTRQDELIAKVAENLRLVAAGLRASAEMYDTTDGANASMLGSVLGGK